MAAEPRQNMDLESAIPVNLKQDRVFPTTRSSNYHPPYPSYCARFSEQTSDIVMAIIGAQFISNSEDNTAAIATLDAFFEAKAVSFTPSLAEMAAVTDRYGFRNIAVIAYWSSKFAYDQWSAGSGFENWWKSLDPEDQNHGWFREIFFPPIERFETIASDNTINEGAIHMCDSMSGPIREHGYWGSMRERLPISQVSSLDGDKESVVAGPSGPPAILKKRITVVGKANLAVIRSGQDWRSTVAAERKLYKTTIHPVLVRGMNYLRDHGDESGCYSCRFMDIINPETKEADLDRTFGLAYFNELASLERWSREHQTHLNIFSGFLKYTKKLQNNVGLKLFHDVLVLEPEQQLFEYINCHEGSGMLQSLK